MMQLMVPSVLLGLLYFDVATTYRQHKEETGWKVIVRDVAFKTAEVDEQVPQIDQSVNTPYNKGENGSDKGEKRGPRITDKGYERKENLRQDSNIPVDPGGKIANKKGPKPGHKLWQYLKGKLKHGLTNSSNATEISGDASVSYIPQTTNESMAPFIVGGVHSRSRTWPWQVSIQYLASDGAWHHFCGGSLVHVRWLVTAAHCVKQLEHHVVRIVLGEYKLTQTPSQGQVIDPSRMLMHAYFDSDSLYYDIAMIKLAHSPNLNLNVNTVAMASSGNDIDSDTSCYITGWGKTVGTSNYMSDTLQESPMTIVSQSDCLRSYSDIIDTQICVESATSSACTGDSGSPLVCVYNHNWILVGLASWIGNEFCLPSSPNVFTRISSYKDWVGNVTVNY